MVAPGSPVEHSGDLKGRKVAIVGAGSNIAELALRLQLGLAGMDHDDVKVVNATFPLMSQMLLTGQVDTVMINEPFLTAVQTKGAASWPTR